MMDSHAPTFARHLVGRSAFRSAIPNRLIGIVREWRRRARSRNELATLSSHYLKDIGYPPSLSVEISKPFWVE
jgi:uncharacterized protein YjiS (DUF1127 family)